jgi:hypothetical protein
LFLTWTPVAVVALDGRNRVSVAAENISAWDDQAFPPEDAHSFVSSLCEAAKT